MQAAAALAVVWAAVWGVIHWADASIPSSEKLLRYIKGRPWETQPRAEVLDQIINDYKHLPFLDKRFVRDPDTGVAFSEFVRGLSAQEKELFVAQTMPPGFQEMVDGFTKMPEKDRMRLLERSYRELLENLSDSPAGTMMAAAGPTLLRKIAEDGLGPFYESLPPDSKLQLQPMIEQMLNNAHRLRD